MSATVNTSIQVQNVSVVVDNSLLLDQVSCAFQTGKIHALLGLNGAGKSTLLNCLSHETMPTTGSILWNDQPLNSFSYAELALQRAVLAQSSELAFSLTVQALVSLGEEVQSCSNRSAEQSDQVVQSVLKVCDITHLKNRDYLTLSGGEKKRAQLARVLAQIWPEGGGNFSGKWLFLDEWTAGLDIKHQQSLGRYFRQWAQQGLGIIMVLHDVSLAAQLADECVMLKAGKVFAQGSVDSVFTQTILQQALEMTVRLEWDKKTQRRMVFPMIESF